MHIQNGHIIYWVCFFYSQYKIQPIQYVYSMQMDILPSFFWRIIICIVDLFNLFIILYIHQADRMLRKEWVLSRNNTSLIQLCGEMHISGIFLAAIEIYNEASYPKRHIIISEEKKIVFNNSQTYLLKKLLCVENNSCDLNVRGK